MKKLLLLIIVLGFSCKKSKDSSIEQHPKDVNNQAGVDNAVKNDTISNSDLEFFNNLDALGIGLIKVNSKDSLTLVKDSERMIENVYNPTITPIFFKPDYDVFYLVCVSEQENNYKVQIDKSGTAVLSKEENINFLSWSKFLLSTTGISNLDWQKNPLRKYSDVKSAILEVNEEDDFIVLKVDGEWIQISNGRNIIGWIKWKQENKLLIEVYLLL